MNVKLHAAANEALARVCARLSDSHADARSRVALTCVDSPLGPLLLGAQDGSIATLEFCDVTEIERRILAIQTRGSQGLEVDLDPVLQRLIEQLDAYFARSLRTFDVPLTYRGSPFQRQVWDELLRIPYGQTCSYGDIARRIGDSGAMRAVGAANHHNPIAIVIPCHRVVNSGGDLGGYGGQVWRKRWLLDLEAGQSHLAF